jgi:hypothetical protein
VAVSLSLGKESAAFRLPSYYRTWVASLSRHFVGYRSSSYWRPLLLKIEAQEDRGKDQCSSEYPSDAESPWLPKGRRLLDWRVSIHECLSANTSPASGRPGSVVLRLLLWDTSDNRPSARRTTIGLYLSQSPVGFDYLQLLLGGSQRPVDEGDTHLGNAALRVRADVGLGATSLFNG